MLLAAAVCVSPLLAGDEDEDGGNEEALVVGAELLDNDEEKLLDQTALDSSANGLANIGATVSASMEETEDTSGSSPRLPPWARSPRCSSQAAGSLDMVGPVSPGLRSAPTSAQMSVPAIIPVSVETLLLVPACAPAPGSVQTAALAPAAT